MYLYDNEDNAPMIDEAWQAAREKATQKKRDELEGLLDMLKLDGECRKCPHITETAEGFLQNGLVSTEQVDYLHLMCVGCHGNGTPDPEHEKRLDKDWADLTEWVKMMTLRHSCIYCSNVYRVYGNYKDTDDEWNALETLCMDCKYFGEV